MEEAPSVLAEVCCPDILSRIASFLPPSEIACTLRLVSRSTAEQFREHTVVRLSQPSPAGAFATRWSAPTGCRALSYKRRLQLVCLTAASGDVGNLEVALAAAGLCPTVEVMATAAAAGQLHVCRWLVERGCPLEGPERFDSPFAGPEKLDSLLAAAARGGHAAVCEWLLDQGCAWSEECVISAAEGGHPELMRALLRKGPPDASEQDSAESLLKAAAEGCDLGTVQELWREMGDGTDPHMLTAAAAASARSPTPDWAAKVAWLLEQGAERHAEACEAAAACPDGVARLTLLVEGMGFPVDATAIDAAAGRGRADAVRWLLARGLRPKPSQCNTAAEWGHTEVLRALHAAGCQLPSPGELVGYACDSGRVETVSWVVETCGAEALHARGLEAIEIALRSGSLELVTWLHERGVGHGSNPWLHATEGGCAAVLELLAEWGVGVQAASSLASHPYSTAAGNGDLLTLEALRRLSVTLGRTELGSKMLVRAAIIHEAPLPALRWLRGIVGEVDWAAAARAINSARRLAGWWVEVQAWVKAEAQTDADRGRAGKVEEVEAAGEDEGKRAKCKGEEEVGDDEEGGD